MSALPEALPVPAALQSAARKAMWRLLPILGAAYFMSYVDRTNVALAKTQLEADVGISAAAYGLGAGIFFLSYALLEVPSNMVLYRIGARVWITRIAVSWGLVSAAMMFVQNEWSFYLLRLALGAAEAGLYPALMYLVMLWFPAQKRVMVVGILYTAPASAIILGSPAGGGLMALDGLGGLHGWQWMFLVEGLVTVLVGLAVWRLLPSGPHDARWLTPAERTAMAEHAASVAADSPTRLRGNLRLAFGRPVVLLLAGVYFFNQVVGSAIGFNVPALVESFGVRDSVMIGLISGSLGVAALLGVLFFPWLQRRIGRDTQLIVACAVLASLCLAGFVLAGDPVLKMALLFLANFFVLGTLPLFWSVAMSRMSGLMAAVGLAFVNMIGLTGSFVGPSVFGALESSGSSFPFVLGSCLAGVVVAVGLAAVVRRERPVEVGGSR
jgi:MFS family permease